MGIKNQIIKLNKTSFEVNKKTTKLGNNIKKNIKKNLEQKYTSEI